MVNLSMTQLGQPLQGFCVGYRGMPVGVKIAFLKVEDENGQAPVGSNARIQLTERPCCCVAGIGQKRLSQLFALPVQAFKRGAGEIDLAADGALSFCTYILSF